MAQRIFITGGAGFIGSHLADRLLEQGYQVVVYDNFSDFYSPSEKRANVSKRLKNPRYHLVEGDILDYELLTSAMKGADVVVHQAAQPGVRFSIKNPEKTHEVNVTGTLMVLKAAEKNEVKKVVFASSSSVYGVPKYLPLDEEHPTNPTSPYAASKLAAEKYCQVFQTIHGLNIVVLRYFSVYGPRMRPDLSLRSFVERVLSGQPPIIYGDGNQSRDWTYIDDAISATVAAIEREEAVGEVFNIGCGNRTTVNQAAHMIISLLGKEGEISPIHEPAYKGDFPHTQANIAKARKILGYMPSVSLEEGVKRLIEWCKTVRQMR